MIIGSALTALTPVIVLSGWEYLCAARFIIGLMHGSSYPCIQMIMAKWLHPDERGFLVSMTFGGSKFGMALILSVGGLIASSTMGWPAIFYISGGIGLAWCVIWWFYVTDTPAKCASISDAERLYLATTDMYHVSDRKGSTPWRAILTSTPFWALFVTHVTSTWGFYLLLNEIPTYLNGVYHFDINSVRISENI